MLTLFLNRKYYISSILIGFQKIKKKSDATPNKNHLHVSLLPQPPTSIFSPPLQLSLQLQFPSPSPYPSLFTLPPQCIAWLHHQIYDRHSAAPQTLWSALGSATNFMIGTQQHHRLYYWHSTTDLWPALGSTTYFSDHY